MRVIIVLGDIYTYIFQKHLKNINSNNDLSHRTSLDVEAVCLEGLTAIQGSSLPFFHPLQQQGGREGAFRFLASLRGWHAVAVSPPARS